MKKGKKTGLLRFVTAIMLCSNVFVARAEGEISAFERDGWSVSLEGDFKVGNSKIEVGGSDPGVTVYKAPFMQRNIRDQWSVGLLGEYTWHPLGKKDGVFGKGFFTRFGIGGEYNKYGNNDQFLFAAEVLLGYTFKLSNIGLEVFTGPVGKFAPNVRSYTGPYGNVGADGDTSSLNEATIRMYSGGASWRFGLGLNVNRFGIYAAYNQSMSDFEHLSTSNVSVTGALKNNRLYNSIAVGVRYLF